MKKKTAILTAAGVLFVSANLVLALHDDSGVKRSSYISSWVEAGKENLTKTFKAFGVVTPNEEHHVYYNDNAGDFKAFLVKKGDKVDSGTPLYEYSSDHVETDRKKLEMEKDQLAREATLIDEQIQQLQYLQSVSSQSSNDSFPASGDGEEEDFGTESGASGEILAYSIEKEIYDKELEKSRILTEIEKYDEIIQSQNDEDQLGINSDVTGVVKAINYELKNPIMTIISDKPKVEGTFAEADLKKAEPGMVVIITSDMLKEKAGGTLTKISSYPEKDPSVGKESRFPFEIELDEKAVDIIKGTHVNISVVTDKVLKAVTVQDTSIRKDAKNSFVYVLGPTGKVEKRTIKKGLQLHSRVEVEKGIEAGQFVVKDPSIVKKADDPFITPLNTNKLSKQPFKEETKMGIFKMISVAFSKR
ncbi:efflux RND transporter periplasmic adaptor subunit [Bacillus sp. T33-2]|uniref:efflux RND transporter periplasmic adaptor subunit n=1 Tax=Bacillus sp. T33-2 TaxID=2054168 RepID=UPI000C78CA45|nr:efflux RND transporter periplasmic adaptor subunit [Bacillus sp. T33-2]PLR94476.1 hypothetical protein CVD19_17470 [Bacillus sp. T33-2]